MKRANYLEYGKTLAVNSIKGHQSKNLQRKFLKRVFTVITKMILNKIKRTEKATATKGCEQIKREHHASSEHSNPFI